MKRTITLGILLLCAVAAFPQMKPGFYAIATARTNDVVVSPTIGNAQAEFAYIGRKVGVSVTALTSTKFETSKLSAVGAKLYYNVATVSNLTFQVGGEALRLLEAERAWRDWAFTGEGSVIAPLGSRFIARASVLGVYHREATKKSDIWRICHPGAAFSIGFRL